MGSSPFLFGRSEGLRLSEHSAVSAELKKESGSPFWAGFAEYIASHVRFSRRMLFTQARPYDCRRCFDARTQCVPCSFSILAVS